MQFYDVVWCSWDDWRGRVCGAKVSQVWSRVVYHLGSPIFPMFLSWPFVQGVLGESGNAEEEEIGAEGG